MNEYAGRTMVHQEFPILEFDPSPRAIIEPSDVCPRIDNVEHCVVCFFKDIVCQVAADTGATTVFEDRGCYGTNQFYQSEFDGHPVVFFHPFVGAPLAAAFLEIAIGLGCRKFVVCGSAGVLDRDIQVGSFVVPDSAVRDEGTSYHYVAPARTITVGQRARDAITSTLDSHHLSYRVGRVWTTDGLFRETPARIALRKSEGCVAVEMEAAALLAVARFRNVEMGYLLFGGDDVSGNEWDQRSGISRLPAKERLFRLSVEACLRL
jgi:uridine phosphorylase